MMSKEVRKVENNAMVPVGDPMMTMIERMAVNPDVDIVKMERLLQMRNDEFARQAKNAYAEAYVQMKPNLPKVISNRKNEQTKSNFATFDKIVETIDSIMSEYGFSHSSKTIKQDKDGVEVETTIWHEKGHTESNTIYMPNDLTGLKGTVNKTKIHATASAITYAQRIGLCQTLNIAIVKDDDGVKAAKQIKYITASQLKTLEGLIEKSGTDKIRFVSEYLKVESLSQLQSQLFDKARSVLSKKIEEKNANS